MQPKLTRWLDRICILGFILLALYLGYSFLHFKYVARPFNEQVWKAADNNSSVRVLMARDVQQRILKPGMTKKQVLQLLGPPYDAPEKNSVRYLLGHVFFGNIDPEMLVIEFDKSGRLKETYIFTS